MCCIKYLHIINNMVDTVLFILYIIQVVWICMILRTTGQNYAYKNQIVAQLSTPEYKGTNKCTKHHLQNASIMKITLFANKICS